MGMNSGFGQAARGVMKPRQPGGLRQMFGGGNSGGGGGSFGSRIAQMMQQRQPPPTPQMTTGPQTGMRPPDQNGVRTRFDHRATAGPGGTQKPMGGPSRSMPPMQGRGNPMQRQMMQAQGMRKPNPSGSRMPMRGRGSRGMGGRGMRRY